MVVLDRTQVDPDSISKNDGFHKDFKVEILFADVCRQCRSSDDIADKCPACYKMMETDLRLWAIITRILDVCHFDARGGQWFFLLTSLSELYLSMPIESPLP